MKLFKKTGVLCYLLILACHISWSQAPQITLEGKITDAVDSTAIPGVVVYFSDLKKGGVTDLNGKYIITGLPQARLRVAVSCVGYNMIATTIDLSQTSVMDFSLV